jgi:hypothetical protein
MKRSIARGAFLLALAALLAALCRAAGIDWRLQFSAKYNFGIEL